MKHIVSFYIALGFVLSNLISIGYNCQGEDMFPEYFGSPFIFVKTSLATSMEYYYGILPIFMNTLLWFLMLLVLRKIYDKLIFKIKHLQLLKVLHKIIVFVLLIFSTLMIYFSYETSGTGFEKGRNYWFLDFDEESNNNSVNCEKRVKFFYQK